MAANMVKNMFDGEEELSIALAEYIAKLSDAAIAQRGVFAIALSGAPLSCLLGKLTKPPYLKTVEWSKWHVFWAEEKILPTCRKHESNYRQTKNEFLSKVPIIPSHIKSVSQTGCAQSAAEAYEHSIRKLVRNRTLNVSVSNDCPKFDLVLLVLGPNGRISSLKPDQIGSDLGNPWVCPVVENGAELGSVTLSVPVINSSENVAITVTGKAVSLIGAVRSDHTSSSGFVKPVSFLTRKDVVWFVDMTDSRILDSSGPMAIVDFEK